MTEDVRERDTASAPVEETGAEPEESAPRPEEAAPPVERLESEAVPEPAGSQEPPEGEQAADSEEQASKEPEPEDIGVAQAAEPEAAEAAEPAEPGEPEPVDAAEAEAPEPAEAEAPEAPEAETAEPAEPEPMEPRAAEVEEGLTAAPTEAVAAAPEATEAEAPETTEAAEVAAPGADPFGGPGDWYVVHTYAGYENKVKTNLESRIKTMQMQDKIFDVVIPMEDVMEIKGGRKQVVQKKVFPGYLLVKMSYDDDSWYVVRNTPGVTGFVSSGTGQKPTPLSRGEVEKILTVKEEEAKKPSFRLDFEEGDVVRIISGPFADFNGTISDINVDQSKVRVMVNIFDRETPVELSFDQVARV
jgi:transcriptional antiterminator NusG